MDEIDRVAYRMSRWRGIGILARGLLSGSAVAGDVLIVGSMNSVASCVCGSMLVSAGWDGTIRLWDVRTGEAVAVLDGHADRVLGVSLSGDGSILASAGRDKTIRLWDVETRKTIATLVGHTGWVECVSFTRDGSMLASASWDRTIRLHRISKLQPLPHEFLSQSRFKGLEVELLPPEPNLLGNRGFRLGE